MVVTVNEIRKGINKLEKGLIDANAVTGSTTVDELYRVSLSDAAVETMVTTNYVVLAGEVKNFNITDEQVEQIIRDLVEKLPVMVTPKWLETKCQPIAVRDVIDFLSKSIDVFAF